VGWLGCFVQPCVNTQFNTHFFAGLRHLLRLCEQGVGAVCEVRWVPGYLNNMLWRARSDHKNHKRPDQKLKVCWKSFIVSSYRFFVFLPRFDLFRWQVLRAIPSLIDGFKPVQRKIMWAAFKRNLKNARVLYIYNYNIYIIHRCRCLSFRSLHSMWMIAAAPRTQKWRNLQDFESWSGSTGQRAETISWHFLTLERIRVGERGISPWWEFSSRPAESEMQRVKDKTSKTFKSSCSSKVRV
jgi:hypothetical protein